MSDLSQEDSFTGKAEGMLRRELGRYPDFYLWRGPYRHPSGMHDTLVVGLSDDKSGKEFPSTVLLTAYSPFQNTVVHLEEDAGHGKHSWGGGLGGIGELTGIWEAIRYLKTFYEPAAK